MPKFSDWFSPSVLLTGSTLLVAVILAYGAIKSDVRDLGTQMRQFEQRQHQFEQRTASLELTRAQDREVLIELRGDVKYIKQQVDRLP